MCSDSTENASPPTVMRLPGGWDVAATAGASSLASMVIRSENLKAMGTLAEAWGAFAKLVYMDPPYNTDREFAHYSDRRGDAWVEFMRMRIRAAKRLLRRDGFMVVQISDAEMAPLQLLLDDELGKGHRAGTVAVKMSEVSGVKMRHVETTIPRTKEYLLFYRASAGSRLTPQRVPRRGPEFRRYVRYYTKWIVNPEDDVSKWELVPVLKHMKSLGLPTEARDVHDFKLKHADRVVYRTNNKLLAGLDFETKTAEVTSPTGLRYVWWEGRQMLFLRDHCDEVLGDIWTDISTINLNKEGGARFRNGKKPEALMRRIIDMTTGPGDAVFDPFGGSGTTAAVAHKLGRVGVTVEEGKQAATHAFPRLASVVRGDDPGGISRVVGWAGGGSATLVETNG